MRPIDADGLKEVFKEKSTEAVCGVELCKAIISQIDNQPTVYAIPIEWIKKYAEEHRAYIRAFEDMLAEWAERKEE